MSYNPDRINIHELTVEEPEKQQELAFDPERDITEEDWKIMKEQLKRYKETGDWSSFYREAAAMKVLNPGKINIEVDKSSWENITNQPETIFKEPLISSVRSLKNLNPAVSLGSLGIDGDFLNQEEKELREYISNHNWLYIHSRASAFRVVEPNLKLDLTDQDWEYAKRYLDKYKEQKDWASFLSIASDLKIIDFKVDLGLTQDCWRGMTDVLSLIKKSGSYLFFASCLMFLKILAAEKVEVTEKGLEITMRKSKLIQGTSPLPETKKF